MLQIFEQAHVVTQDEIDELGHVNNLVYLRWFNEVASAHSRAHGWPTERYIELQSGWVVRKHEIEYLIPAFLGEELLFRTWVATIRGSSSLRRYEILRGTDQRIVAKGCTLWVWINFLTGRSERIPSAMVEAFEIVPDEPITLKL